MKMSYLRNRAIGVLILFQIIVTTFLMKKKQKLTQKEKIIKSPKRLVQAINKGENTDMKDDQQLIMEHVKKKLT